MGYLTSESDAAPAAWDLDVLTPCKVMHIVLAQGVCQAGFRAESCVCAKTNVDRSGRSFAVDSTSTATHPASLSAQKQSIYH